ncbi:unnamed protein product [Tenebrio molitor]|nr:unnamed protein product [Tenebrio molitor]
MCPGCNITIQLLNSIHNNITESFIRSLFRATEDGKNNNFH